MGTLIMISGANGSGKSRYAERIVALNSPLMQLCVYFNMVFVLFVGSKLIITNGGTTIDVRQLILIPPSYFFSKSISVLYIPVIE